MKNYSIFLMLLLIPFSGIAQMVDSTYIKQFENKLGIKAYSGQDFIYLFHEDSNGTDRTYRPNKPASVGAGFMWKNSMLSFSYGFGVDFLRDKSMGKTKSIDFQFHSYSRRFLYDIYIQKYKGFYDDETKETPVFYPDLKIEQYGINWQYIFNKKRFSHMAAFDQSERQLKSAGSLILGGGVYQSKIESDTAFIVDEKKVFRKFQFGINGGYAYTWVIDRHWLLGGSVTAGINFGAETFSKIGKQPLTVSPAVLSRIAAGYNRTQWSLGFSYVNNIIFESFNEKSNIGISAGHFQFTYIRRFRTIPFLPEKWLDRLNKLFP